MSLALIQSLAASDRVCRFCLHKPPSPPSKTPGESPPSLMPIFEAVLPYKPNIVTINTTVRNVLGLLGIQIAQSDPYPNLICTTCRNLLYSIDKFKETARKSTLALDKARLLREFPTVKFDDVRQDSPQEFHEEEIVVEVEEDCSEKVEDVPEPELEVLEEVEEQEAFYLEAEEVPSLKEEVEDPAESEYAETEWITYDEEPIEDCTEEQLEEPKDEEDTATIYLDEELEELENEPEEPNQKSSKTGNICPICGKSSTALVVHMRIHTNQRPFVCDQCPKAYFTSNKLKVHVESVHHGSRPFQCEICSKSFALRKTLNAHLQSHLPAAEMEFSCDACSKKFPFRWALEKHRRIHTGERPFICTLDGCGKSFASSSNLRQHQKTNAHWSADLPPRQDVCGDCGVVFKTKYALRAHRKVAHSAVKGVAQGENSPLPPKVGRPAGCPDEEIFSALSRSLSEYLAYRASRNSAQKRAFEEQLAARIGYRRKPRALSMFLARKRVLIARELGLEQRFGGLKKES